MKKLVEIKIRFKRRLYPLLSSIRRPRWLAFWLCAHGYHYWKAVDPDVSKIRCAKCGELHTWESYTWKWYGSWARLNNGSVRMEVAAVLEDTEKDAQ